MTATKIEDLPNELVNALRQGNALIICGAGVSTQATNGNAPGWLQLINTALDTAIQEKLLSAEEIDSCNSLLKNTAPLKAWLSAAATVRNELSKDGDGPFRAFLKEKLGSLDITHPAIVNALYQLRGAGNLLATTNYDDILTKERVPNPITWLEKENIAEFLTEKRDAIWHLHGHWETPESIVFCEDSYKTIRASETAQFLQDDAAFNRTLVFVGCSTDGLADQNVGELLREFFSKWSGIGHKHFAFCKAGDETKDWPSAITAIPYGDEYEDLPKLLSSLGPAAKRSEQHQLPPNPNMIGREHRRNELIENLVSQERPVIVPGALGMGKTTLAVSAAHDERMSAHFGDAIHFIDLEPIEGADRLLRAVAESCDIDPKLPDGGIINSIRLETEKAPICIILDNLETTWRADKSNCESILAQLSDISGLHLCLTVRGEVPKISGGAMRLKDVEELSPEDAKMLFLRHAGNQHADSPGLDALLEALEGHALSIELLAMNAGEYGSLEQLLSDWLEFKTELLTKGVNEERLSSLRASVKISLNRLKKNKLALRLMSLVALLPAGMHNGDINIFLPDAGLQEKSALYRAGLVGPVGERTKMLAPIREAIQELRPPNQIDEMVLVDHYLALCAEGKKSGTTEWPEVQKMVIREAANLDPILTRAIELLIKKNPWLTNKKIYDSLKGLSELITFSGKGGIKSLKLASTASQKLGDSNLRFISLFNLGLIYLDRGDYKQSTKHILAAQKISIKFKVENNNANCISALGEIIWMQGKLEAAEKHYDAALLIYTREKQALGQANCNFLLGKTLVRQDKYLKAKHHLDLALQLYKQDGRLLGVAGCTRAFGDLALRQNRYSDANEFYSSALTIYENNRDINGQANCNFRFGEIKFSMNSDLSKASSYWQLALELYQQVADYKGIGFTAVKLARYGQKSDHKKWQNMARESFTRVDRLDFIERFVDGDEDTASEF